MRRALRGHVGGVAAAVLGLLLLAIGTPMSLGAYGHKVTNTTNNAASSVWATTCLAQAKSDDALSFWRFDEASGNTATEYINGTYSATYNSRGVTYRNAVGPCPNDDQRNIALLNGSTGYIYGPKFGTSPTTFTVEVWFKTTTQRGGKIYGLGSSQTGASTTYDRNIYMTNSGQLVFGLNGNGIQTVTSPSTYRDGAWHQAVGVLAQSGASKGITLYVDGVAVAANASYTSVATAAVYTRIGYDNLSNSWPSSPSSDYFAGNIADVSLYLSALPPEQVKAHYDAGS